MQITKKNVNLIGSVNLFTRFFVNGPIRIKLGAYGSGAMQIAKELISWVPI